MRGHALVVALAAVAMIGACGADEAGVPASGAPTSEVTTTVTPTATPTGPDAPAPFTAAIAAAPAGRMTSSWRPGCPVALDELRLLTVSYWGFDGAPHTGELVVAESVASDVVDVLETLYDARFPIRRMVLVDEYEGDDDLSMAANNTSGFNCRTVAGTDTWSRHAYGFAIDINPCENPYIQANGTLSPPECARFADRGLDEPGMIHADDEVVRAFAGVGWEWGGAWTSPKDYQHFALPR